MNSDKTDWKPCPEGELTQLACRLEGQRAKSKNLRTGILAASASLVLVLGVISYSVMTQPGASQQTLSALDCRTVRGYLVEYISDDLDKDLSGSIKAHLDHCGHCRDKYHETRKDQVSMVSFDK